MRLGVLGWPVAHSRSPAMHNAAFAAVGLRDWRYQHLPVPPELFAETVRALPAAGFGGANVTVPHKEAAVALADSASATATAIGAANTLTFAADGTIHADNTDAPGILAALGDAAPCTALVLGAGGSARAAVYALASRGTRVSILNRSRDRAEALAAEMGATVVDGPVPADLLVHCTPIGLRAGDPAPLDPAPYATVIDLVYREGGTALTGEAQAAGARVVDGLDVLVAQGALSFELWTGRRAPRDVMSAAAR